MLSTMLRMHFDTSHRLGTVHERIGDVQYDYLSLDDLREFSLPQPGTDDVEPYPYPVVHVTADYDVHLCPVGTDVVVWLVERASKEIVAEQRGTPGGWFDAQRRRDLADQLAEGESDIDEGDIEDALGDDRLQDPFDQELIASLRPPTSRWLRQRTASVTARRVEYTNGEYVRTRWEVELAPESTAVDYSTATFDEYHTDDLLKASAQKFERDYRQRFHHRIYLGDKWWCDLSLYWLQEALVRDHAAADLADRAPDDFELGATRSGTYHLFDEDTDECECHAQPQTVDRRAFDLEALPLPHRLCNHCLPTVKRLQFTANVR